MILDLATQYHQITEAYDRTVCTGPVRSDGIMPKDTREASLVNAHAREVYLRLLIQAERRGYSKREWHMAVLAARPRPKNPVG